ncbi:iron ABC transporter permease [Paenibacillus sp. SC116]|uniref:FecCD family ABC transporter permease n=1 Tax=Paenibacillus sp. SC116 TaxID=2968986 RepID=UPI00215B48AE|nr:iron ABC transporter permease [Paenibacillus sp. SC116]MCR8842087.1 iron ABC transporter permease [Paenibacillus sp. SC116]
MRQHITFRTKSDSISLQIERKSLIVISVLFFLSILAVIAGTSLGNTVIPPLEVVQSILKIGSGEHDFVIHTLRLPRVLVALLVGAALGVSGAILQGIIRNPLASPDIIGITGGASVAAVAFVTFLAGTVSISFMPFAAIVGAMVVSITIYLLAWKNGVTPIRLVLVGIGISAIMGAGTTFMLVMSPYFTAGKAYIWLTGSVYGSTWEDVYLLLPVTAVVIPSVVILARNLNLQEFGDEVATGLGAAVQRQRLILLALSVLLAGVAVSIGGAIGFVGLIAPHIARKLVGRPFGSLTVVSALIGALLVFVADWIGRTAFYPLDIPAGIFTAGVGAPFFLYLLFKNRNQL